MAFDPRPVMRDGKPVDWLTDMALQECERRLGYPLTVLQGRTVGTGVAASAGTHDGWGVVDLAPWDHENKVRVAKAVGFFAWFRPELWRDGKRIWPDHIHMGLIDHPALAPEAAAQQVDYLAHPPRDGLADHAPDPSWHPSPPVVFHPKQRTLLGGSFNCHAGRDPFAVRKAVIGILARHELDFLALQEADGYTGVLKGLPGYRLVEPTKSGEALLVRDGALIQGATSYRLGFRPWFYGRKMHPARVMSTAVLDGWLRVGSVHPVPKPGPRRFSAYAANMRRLARFANDHPNRPLVYVGDWNKLPTRNGPSTPSQLAHDTGASIYGPEGALLDYTIARKCTVTDARLLDEGGSDHPLLIFTVKERPRP